ncbi:hypothetical protein Ancab_032418 [Ancistrocladus abbreviatus]
MDQLTTLCGVDGFLLIFNKEDGGMFVWPSREKTYELLAKFQSMPSTQQRKKMLDHDRYMQQRNEKLRLEIARQEKRNKELEASHLMHLLTSGRGDEFTISDWNLLTWYAEEKLQEIQRWTKPLPNVPIQSATTPVASPLEIPLPFPPSLQDQTMVLVGNNQSEGLFSIQSATTPVAPNVLHILGKQAVALDGIQSATAFATLDVPYLPDLKILGEHAVNLLGIQSVTTLATPTVPYLPDPPILGEQVVNLDGIQSVTTLATPDVPYLPDPPILGEQAVNLGGNNINDYSIQFATLSPMLPQLAPPMVAQQAMDWDGNTNTRDRANTQTPEDDPFFMELLYYGNNNICDESLRNEMGQPAGNPNVEGHYEMMPPNGFNNSSSPNIFHP